MSEEKDIQKLKEITEIICDAYAGQIRYLGGAATVETVYNWAEREQANRVLSEKEDK